MSIHETVKTQKQYYLHNMRSAYFPIDRGCTEKERGRERERGSEREAMSIHVKLVKTQKWYYLHHKMICIFAFQ